MHPYQIARYGGYNLICIGCAEKRRILREEENEQIRKSEIQEQRQSRKTKIPSKKPRSRRKLDKDTKTLMSGLRKKAKK
jgi:hypothetical protein